MKPDIAAALVACVLFSGAGSAAAQRTTPGGGKAVVEMTVEVNGRGIRYLHAGSGPNTIVLLHGWPQNAHEWRRVIPLLADHFTVLAPDLPGIGGSAGPADDVAAPDSKFEKATLARDIHAFVESLGPRRIVLVGHDIGGMIAYAYARLYPDELAGVAILDVPLPGIAPWDTVKTMPEAWHFGFHQQSPLAEQLVAGRQTRYFRYFIDRHADDPSAITDADVANYAAAYQSPASLHAGFGLYRSFAADEQFNTSRGEPFNVPVLLVGAEHSVGPSVVQIEAGLRALGASDIRMATVPNSGHWLAEEQPAATASLIADFAATHP